MQAYDVLWNTRKTFFKQPHPMVRSDLKWSDVASGFFKVTKVVPVFSEKMAFFINGIPVSETRWPVNVLVS